MMSEPIVMDLHDPATFAAWRAFLSAHGIENFAVEEVAHLDIVLGLHDEAGRLVATGSAAGPILKYIATSNADATPGSRFNAIVSALMSDRARRKIFHLFVYTKPRYIASFAHLGFTELARVDIGGVLETGDRGIRDYLAAIPRVPDQASRRIGAIVMNANPFTCGHRALVERAARACDHVYVFVVSDDVSLFSTAARTELVRAGVADLEGVSVVAGGPYMVSFVTFPAYFIASPDDAIRYQTALDARLFKRWIVPALNIGARYLGTEPRSPTTERYNEALARELPPEVDVEIMERAETGGRPISATEVRGAIATGALDVIAELVPASTLAYITRHLHELQVSLRKE